MKKRVKSILFYIVFLISFVTFSNVQALTVSNNNLTVDSGKTASVELYANTDVSVSSVDFTLVFSTYDIEADFDVNDKYMVNTNGTKYHVTLDEPQSGKILLGNVKINVKDKPKDTAGIINIHSASGIGTDDKTINFDSQVINVSVNKKTVEEETTTTKAITTKKTTTTKKVDDKKIFAS